MVEGVNNATGRRAALGRRWRWNRVQIREIALGVALTDKQGRPWGAIHIAASLSEWTAAEFTRQVAPLALEAVRAIRSGY